MKASEVLRGGLKNLDGGNNWIGGGCHGTGHCAWTALPIVARRTRAADSERFLRASVGAAHNSDVWRWNDAPERTFADVEAAFQKAIQLAEAEGN